MSERSQTLCLERIVGRQVSMHGFEARGKVAASMIFEECVELLQPRVATLDAQSVANVRRPGFVKAW